MDRNKIQNPELIEKAHSVAIELSGRPADWGYHIAKEDFHLEERILSEGGEKATVPYFYDGVEPLRMLAVTKRLLESDVDTSDYNEEKGIRFINRKLRPDKEKFTLSVEWFLYPSGRIRRRYEGVEVPEEFRGWNEDRKGEWISQAAHAHFGENGGLTVEREVRNEENLRLEQLDKVNLIDEDGKMFY
jgi:hypothetical protein